MFGSIKYRHFTDSRKVGVLRQFRGRFVVEITEPNGKRKVKTYEGPWGTEKEVGVSISKMRSALQRIASETEVEIQELK